MLDDVWCSDAAAVCLFRSTVRTISVVKECEKKILENNNNNKEYNNIIFTCVYIYIA